jgi:membrane protease YdiL (CAAX protease family)
VPLRSSTAMSTVPVSDVSKVVVGSRAEAKAVRKAAERAAKERKGAKPGRKVVPFPSPAQQAAGGAAAGQRSPVAASAPEAGAGPIVATAPSTAPRKRERPHAAERPVRRPARDLSTSGSPVAWTLLDAAAVLGVLALAVLAKNAVLALPQVGLMPQVGKSAVRAVVLGVFYTLQIAAFGWLAGRHAQPALVGFRLRRPPNVPRAERPSAVGSAALAVALFIGCEVFSIGYGLTMQALNLVQPERLSSDLATVFGGGPVGLALAALLVVVAAPFAEEIAFRGVVLPAVGDRWGMWAGIAASSVVYAAYHASVWLFVPTLVLGVALGWLSWTRRSLWPAVLVHVLFNATAVLAAFSTVK